MPVIDLTAVGIYMYSFPKQIFLPHHLSAFSEPSSGLQFWSDFHFPVDILNRTNTQLTLAGRLTAGIEETD